MDITRDIQTLSDFKQNASKMVKQVQETKRPMVLTVNGKPAVVLQDPESFQQSIYRQEYQETIKVLRARIADIDESDGNWPSHKEAFDEIRKKFDIERD
jgi:prevent-host-death family protein